MSPRGALGARGADDAAAMHGMNLDAYFDHEEGAAWVRGEKTTVATELRIAAKDGYVVAATLFAPKGPARGVVLLASAIGVKRRFYARFATYLAEGGLATLTLDYRGIGDSRPASLRGFETTLHDWAELDLAAAATELHARFPDLPLLWVGHSVGGQLMGFVPEAKVHAAMFVASQSGYFGHWNGLGFALMATLWHAAIPGIVPLAGYLPSRVLGLGEDLPAGVATEWARWGRDPDYLLLHARERHGGAFLTYEGPLRSLTIADDAYAPARAVRALVDCYPFAAREVVRVRPRDVGVTKIGHFGFFAPRFRRTLWSDARAWLSSKLD